MLNTTQENAYDLIKSDAKFIYSLMTLPQRDTHIDSNYMMMSLPYLGLFTSGT